MRRGKLTIVAMCCTTLVALTACGGGSSSSGSSDPVAGGGTLVIGSYMSSFPSLDTGAITTAGFEGQREIGNLVYEGLTKRDVSDPNGVPGVAPALATSWTTSPDGMSYTFALREGVTFQDGTPWNADALIFNFDRYTNKANPYYDPQLIIYYQVLNFVKAATKIDDYTVKFEMNSPDAYLLADLYNVYFASPASLKQAGSAGQAKHPVGTGPFTFGSQQGNQSMKFTRNNNYWGTVPKLQGITVVLIPDPAARTAALKSGRVNWIESVPSDDLASLKDGGFTITQNAYDWSWSWQFLVDKKPFDDVRVRQAINYAIDRKAISDDLLKGTGYPQYQAVGPASPFYDEANDIYEYDPAKAKELLTAAGYPDGFTTSIGYVTSSAGAMEPAAMNTAIQSQLAKVGIKLDIEPAGFSTIDADLVGGQKGWSGENSELSLEQPSFWSFLWACGKNEFNYCNKSVDALLTQAQQTQDDTARTKLLTQVIHLVTLDAPWLFVVGDTSPRALAPTVKGFVQPKSWWINFNDVYISK